MKIKYRIRIRLDFIVIAILNFYCRLINLFSWSGLIDTELLLKDVFQVPNLKTGKMEPLMTALTEREEEQFRNMLNRINKIFSVNCIICD